MNKRSLKKAQRLVKKYAKNQSLVKKLMKDRQEDRDRIKIYLAR